MSTFFLPVVHVQVGDNPNHPPQNYKFPVTNVANKNRSCQSQWFSTWKWLHYDASQNRVFCHPCSRAVQEKKCLNKRPSQVFTQSGFFNWKRATEKFREHESSECHRECVEKMAAKPVHKDIAESLSEQNRAEKEQNRECLKKIIETLKYLTRQGIPLRKGGNEADSNFYQLLNLMAKHDPVLSKWLEKKRTKYCSPEIQNELIDIMAQEVLRDLLAEIRQSGFFSFMCDETTDSSNLEQCVCCIRWCSDDFEVFEDLIGLYELHSTTSDSVTSMIKDVFLRCNLSFQKCRGQCYDGANAMKGCKKGVATQIKAIEPRQVLIMCVTLIF